MKEESGNDFFEDRKQAALSLIQISEQAMREARTDKLILFLKLRYKDQL